MKNRKSPVKKSTVVRDKKKVAPPMKEFREGRTPRVPKTKK